MTLLTLQVGLPFLLFFYSEDEHEGRVYYRLNGHIQDMVIATLSQFQDFVFIAAIGC